MTKLVMVINFNNDNRFCDFVMIVMNFNGSDVVLTMNLVKFIWMVEK